MQRPAARRVLDDALLVEFACRSPLDVPEIPFALVAGSTAGLNGLSRVFGGDERPPREPVAEGPDVSVPTTTNGDIVFTSARVGDTALFRVSPDGSDLRQLTPDGAAAYTSPDVSPDGRTIVVVHRIPGFEPGESVLATVPIDGGAPTWLTPEGWVVADPAWSPDGSRLAYVEMDRYLGEARLVAEEVATGKQTVLGTLPVPEGSGSSIPEAANLSWSPDGQLLAFEFGRNAADRAIYLSYADGRGLVRVADSAHAPAISADGKCLAYISHKHVFLMDLANMTATPDLLADLPAGRGASDFRLDKLQWRP